MGLRIDKRRWLLVELVVAMLWIGLLLGASFLATPAKMPISTSARDKHISYAHV